MPSIIGTDEAGYGPNLGPLVISATVWNVPDVQVDLYELLRDAVTQDPAPHRNLVSITDSKLLYKSRAGLNRLEKALLPALATTGRRPRTWQTVWRTLDPKSRSARDHLPWYQNFDAAVSQEVDGQDLDALTGVLTDTMHSHGVQLDTVRSMAIFPEQFNSLIDEFGSKGAVLSRCTLALVRDLLDEADSHTLIQCDKHGGRNRYGPFLEQMFPDAWIEVHREGREESVYRWTAQSRRIEIQFVTQAESFLPSALASVASKYLRELAMQAFNQFWCRHVPNLVPTAGYPADAQRFKGQINAAQRSLGIEDRMLWRKR